MVDIKWLYVAGTALALFIAYPTNRVHNMKSPMTPRSASLYSTVDAIAKTQKEIAVSDAATLADKKRQLTELQATLRAELRAELAAGRFVGL